MSTDRPETEHEMQIGELIFGEVLTMKPRLFLWQDFTAESTQTDILWLALNAVTNVSLFGDTLQVETAQRVVQTDDPDTIARFFEEWEVV